MVTEVETYLMKSGLPSMSKTLKLKRYIPEGGTQNIYYFEVYVLK